MRNSVALQINRRRWLQISSVFTAASVLRPWAMLPAQSKTAVRDIAPWSLYAFDNGLNGPDVPTIEAKAALLKKLGYAGMTDHYNLRRLPQILEQLDRHGLEFASLYYTPAIENGIEPQLQEAIKLLKGRRARIEIGFTSKQYKPSDPAADAKAIDELKRVADWAGDTGPVISIYPHKGFWTERVEDGLRLGQKVGLKTVGTNFNLIHYTWATPLIALPKLLADALPHLMLVTINGIAGKNIVPLAEGDYDVRGFLKAVKEAGYKGPIGLQCYSIPGPSEAHLRASMAKWQEWKRELAL